MVSLRFKGFRNARKGARKEKLKRRFLMGVAVVPTLVTLGNLLCGFASIVLAMRIHNPPQTFRVISAADCVYYSGLLIFLAMIFDALDGRVARWTKSTSKFGMEMDSLCDVVSFGVAPAVLVKAAIDHFAPDMPVVLLDRYVWPMLAVYVCCAALRLARYNVESESGHRDFFFGIPSPAAAGCVAGIMVLLAPAANGVTGAVAPASPDPLANPLLRWVCSPEVSHLILLAMPFVMLLIGVLMISRVHYIHVGDKLLSGKRSFMHLLIIGLGIVLTVMQHEIVLAAGFNGFMLMGVLNEIRYQLFPGQRPPEWVASVQAESESQAPAADLAAAPLRAEAPDSGTVTQPANEEAPPA
ncbi:MAG: CDP-alcohol phosphatidyltransferase family protein [Planctomycetes bacterium]|nr:CDP-alcohol phosphatidyltransferase family protein [Planctomycetota bacterium]